MSSSEKIIVPALSFEEVLVGATHLGQGAEGTLYAITTEAAARSGLRVSWSMSAKIFRPSVALRTKEHLERAVAWLWALSPQLRGRVLNRLLWPMALVRREEETCGVLLRDIGADYGVEVPATGVRRLVMLSHCLGEDDLLARQFGLPVHLDDATRLAILAAICECVAAAHESRILLNDYTESSVALRFPDRSVEACLLVGEDLVLPGETSRPVSAPLWTPPRDEPLSQARDVYLVGLTAGYLLTRHRRVRLSDAGRLPAPLREVYRRSLAADPARRPQITEWLAGLDAALGPLAA